MATKEQVVQRLEEFFAESLLEAEEAIKDGTITPDDVVNSFAAALTSWHEYFQSGADIYEKLINAIISRYRNK